MILVGDDVVDLDDPAIAEHHLRARFVERVCTESERAALATAADPKRALWSLFAAKEAAYKVAIKLGLEPGFAHRRFVVEGATVRYAEHVLSLRVDDGEGWVHATVTTHGPAAVSTVELLQVGGDASAHARDALLRAIADRLGRTVAKRALAVVRDPRPGSWDGFGPPRVTGDGEPLAVDVSLSHDGRFVGFALV